MLSVASIEVRLDTGFLLAPVERMEESRGWVEGLLRGWFRWWEKKRKEGNVGSQGRDVDGNGVWYRRLISGTA